METVSKWLVCGVAGMAFAFVASAAKYDASTGYVQLTSTGNKKTGSITPFNVATENDWWSDGRPPHSDTNYFIPDKYQFATPTKPGADLTWQGGPLVSDGRIWLVSNKAITFENLTLLGYKESFYVAGTPGPLRGNITIQGTISDPTVFQHYGNSQMILDATMFGEADSVFQFNKSLRDAKVFIRGNWDEFNGTLLLTRNLQTEQQGVATNGYYIETATIAGKLQATSGDTVDTKLVITNAVTVGALELDGGVELAFGDEVNSKSAPGCLTVTGDVTLNGKPRIAVGSVNCAFDTSYSYPLLRFKDKEGQELILDDFEIVVGSVADATFGTFKLRWEIGDSTTLVGYRELRIVKVGPVGDLVGYNQAAVAVTDHPESPFVDQKDSKGIFFWEDEGTPVSGKSYVITNKTAYMRGPDAESPCQFLGEELYFADGLLYASSSTASAGGFEAKCMYWNGVRVQIWNNQGVEDKTIDGSVKWFSFYGGRIYVPEGTAVKNISYNKQGVKFASEIIGSGTFNLSVAEAGKSTGRQSYNLFCAQNTNFTGRICVSAATAEPVVCKTDGLLAPTDKNCVSLFVTNGLSLGGKCSAFTYDALTLERYGCLRVETCDVELADGLNRGVYINGIGRMTVKEGLALTVNRPITVNGTFRKQGAGTLALGGMMRFTDGAEETLPAESNNLVRIEEGVLRLDAEHALDGAAITFAEGTKLVLKESDANTALATKGLVNVKGNYADIVSEAEDGKVEVEIDISALTSANEATFGLVTVATEEAANALATKLVTPRNLTMDGQSMRRTAVSVASADGGATWTVSAKYEKTGLVIIFR